MYCQPTVDVELMHSALVESCVWGRDDEAIDKSPSPPSATFLGIFLFLRRCGSRLLSPDRWSRALKAIVEHEARYGFAQKHRVVMYKPLSAGASSWL